MWAPVFFYISKGLSSARGASARANNDEFQNPLSRAATEGTAMYLPERCTVRVYSIVASSVRGVSLGLKRCVCLSSSMAWVGGGSKLASSLDRWGNLLMLPKLFAPLLLPSCLPKIGVVVDLVEKIPPLAAAQANQRFKLTGTRGRFAVVATYVYSMHSRNRG